MLFTQADLNTSISSFDILNESIYIDHNTISPNTVGVVINEDLNAGIVRFNDVESISEEYGCDYIDAMIAIAEANDIDPNQLAVAIDEAEIIENPTIIYELANVVINPISENSLAYIFCESMIDAYIETDDEDYLYGIVEDSILNEYSASTMASIQSIQNDPNISSAEKVRLIGHLKAKDTPVSLTRNPQSAKSRSDTHTIQRLQKQLDTATNDYENISKQNADLTKQNQEMSNKWYTKLGKKVDKVGQFIGNHSGKIGLGIAAGTLAHANKDELLNTNLGKKVSDKYGDTKVGKFLGLKRQEEAPKEVTNIEKVAKEAEGKPKRWISRKIASLRKIYANYLQKAREAGPNAGTFKKIASKILGVIDMLLEKLENFTA